MNKLVRVLFLLILVNTSSVAYALQAGSGVSVNNGILITSSSTANFISNAASLSCSSSAGKLIIDSTADTLSYCSSGGSTVKYAALGNDSGESTAAGANSVDMPGDTTGNYVSNITGTSNEISVTLLPGEDANATLGLPSVIDIGGKTSFEIPNAAAPTVNVFGQIAGDNNLWGASRGAVVAYDGTASTALVGTLVSDTPADKQIPQWNTGGTITWEYNNGGGIDVRNYGLACDGSTDDASALSAAYASLNAAGGGTLVIPLGKTCMVGSDVSVKSKVNLKCEPGGTIKSTAGGSFTLGLLSWFSSADNSSVEGCTFDLNGKATSAIWTSGDDISIRRNVFKNGATTNGSNWNVVRYGCSSNASQTTSNCEFAMNRIECGSTSGAKDTGVIVAGGSNDPLFITVRNNQIRGCDIDGIAITTPANVQGNAITTVGTSATGINVTGQYTTVDDNRISGSGTSAYGIKLNANNVAAQGNRISMSGTATVGIRSYGANTTIVRNRYTLSAASGTSVGIYLGDGGSLDYPTSVIGNIGVFGTTDSQTHIVVATSQANAIGNLFTGGKYCAVPSQASSTEFENGFNFDFEGNRCYSQGTTGVIAVTGWTVVGNYIAWIDSGGTAAIEVGDDRTYKVGTSHTLIGNNLLSSIQPSVAGIKINEIEKTCTSGTKIYQACVNDNTTDCPSGTCPGCCNEGAQTGSQIVGNDFVMGSTTSGPAIDFSTAITSSTSSIVRNWVITGNTFDMATNGSVLGIKCPSSNQTRMTKVEVGTNSYYAYTSPAHGDTSKGRLDSNCTPDMVADAYTSMIWLPAAGCNNTTGYPAFDLPTASAPTATCAGTTYNRGFLSYPDASDTAAFTSVFLPAGGTHQFFVRPVYTVNATNTLSTRWGFSATCFGDNTDIDSGASWTTQVAEEYMNTAYNNSPLDFEVPSTYATFNGIVCGGGATLSIRTRRIGSNSTSGQDDQTNASLLYGIQLYARRVN